MDDKRSLAGCLRQSDVCTHGHRFLQKDVVTLLGTQDGWLLQHQRKTTPVRGEAKISPCVFPARTTPNSVIDSVTLCILSGVEIMAQSASLSLASSSRQSEANVRNSSDAQSTQPHNSPSLSTLSDTRTLRWIQEGWGMGTSHLEPVSIQFL